MTLRWVSVLYLDDTEMQTNLPRRHSKNLADLALLIPPNLSDQKGPLCLLSVLHDQQQLKYKCEEINHQYSIFYVWFLCYGVIYYNSVV